MAGELCYKKGGSALAYSKKSSTAGRLIYKGESSSESGYYFVLEFGTSNVRWVYSKSSATNKPMYLSAVNGWSVTTNGVAWNKQTSAKYKSSSVAKGTYDVDHSVNFTLSTTNKVGTHDGYRYNAIVDTTFSYTVKSYNAQTNVLVHEASISRTVDVTGSSSWAAGDTVDCVLNALVITLAADGTFTLSFR